MRKKYVYTFLTAIVAGQAVIGFYESIFDTKKIETRFEAIDYQNQNRIIENQENKKSKSVTEVVYKYKKKKDFSNIENSVIAMKKQKDHFSGSGNKECISQPVKIAKVLSGKLLIGQV